MNSNIKLAIITDDPPVNEEVLAAGMCRVNTRLFSALLPQITLIIIVNLGTSLKQQDIAKNLQDKSIFLKLPLPRLLFKAIGRLFPTLRNLTSGFQTMLPTLVKRLHETRTDWIFCPCGVNPSALGRGILLSKASGIPLAVYLVDDFLDGAILSGNKEHLCIAKKSVPQWLCQVEKLFVISEGLRYRLKKLYNVDSIVLPLPYQIPENLTQNLPKPDQVQIIFVGSLSHFYIDGLRQLASILDELNKVDNQKIILRLTSSSIKYARKLIGDFNCLKCEPCLSSEDLYREIASSFLCFAPYSFDEKYKVMISSSFPSKMLDYLASGKFIMVYSPEYSSSVSYFKQHEIPGILSIEDPVKLRHIITKQLNQQQDYSEKYRAILQSYHSYNYLHEQLLHNLTDK